MKEFKGTPGPWVYRESDRVIGVIDRSDTQSYGMVTAIAYIDIYDTDCYNDNARLIAAAPELLEAALFAERRSKQPEEGHTEYFERLADEFYLRHGYLAPGKDDPLRSVSIEEAREEWGRFLNEPGEARRAAIAKALGETE